MRVRLVEDYRRSLDAATSIMSIPAGAVIDLYGPELTRLLESGMAVPYTKHVGKETR